MSFGFSVGDFLAAGKLILDIIESLQDVGGAKSEYQELIHELRSLEKALQHLDQLQSDSAHQGRIVQSIKFAALSCRQPLELFLAKIKKFDSTLDVWSKGQTSKTIVRKIHWGLGMKSEVTKLQGYLNLHVNTINMLLATHSLEKISLAQERADSDSFQVRQRLDAAQDTIERIGNTIPGQMALVQRTHTVVKSLMDMICGEFRTSWRSLGQMVAQLCVSMQQIHGVVLEIKASITPVDTRFTFFQTPLVCEDALGIKFPIPSEWDYGMVESHIRYRFREGVGSRDVEAGNWELFKTRNSKEIVSSVTRLLPGLEITMAIIVAPPILSDEICPIFSCRSHETTLAPAGGRICCDCGTYFSRATKKRVGLEALAVAINSKSIESTHPRADLSSSHQGEGVQNSSASLGEQDGLKNVRWSEEDPGLASLADESKMELPGEDDTLLSSISSALPRHNPILNEALAYLDRVKSTYPEEPMMYNMFLDIMKHFKIGKLDTPGVINSIVGLFGEETALINEFNMFLPPGYKLETNPHSDACIVRVTIPDGTILTSLAGGKRKQRDELDKGGSDGIDDAFASTEQHKPRPKKRRRLRQASDRF